MSDEGDTTSDLIAGWLGGAVGILISNPLEVLKVRLQTTRVESTSANPIHHGIIYRNAQKGAASLRSLWAAEGSNFLFAGAAGPILALAFIDSAFFGIYGLSMRAFHQDRQNPDRLSQVFVSGAFAGGVCALLQTPIEVVKCCAQAEGPSEGKKLGSFKIAREIARQQGLRGFYIGGLMTAIRDGVTSGLFFVGYFVFRRMLRGEPMFAPSGAKREDESFQASSLWSILLAGGVAGSLAAVVPYPFDIIKTRLQTANVNSLGTLASASTPKKTTTMRDVVRGIYQDGLRQHPSLSPKIAGLRGFFVGIRPTIASSFVGSAATITTFEVALYLLGQP